MLMIHVNAFNGYLSAYVRVPWMMHRVHGYFGGRKWHYWSAVCRETGANDAEKKYRAKRKNDYSEESK